MAGCVKRHRPLPLFALPGESVVRLGTQQAGGGRVCPYRSAGLQSRFSKITPEGITLEVRAGSGALLLRYGLHKALDVSVVLYDMQGRTVGRMDLGRKPAGYHEQRVGLEAAAHGAYSAVLGAGGSRSSRVVVRR